MGNSVTIFVSISWQVDELPVKFIICAIVQIYIEHIYNSISICMCAVNEIFDL